MVKILGPLGALLCCAFLSTCGTYRAVTDDYEADYIIRDIKPLAGVSGEQVIFEAAICTTAGSTPIDTTTNEPQWIWNFGGGADPNVSYEAKPQVTLRDGLRAPYACSLTVRDGCLEDNVVEATFTLDVEPLSILAVTPSGGIEDGTATFSVLIGTGNVSSYAWNFGTACTPSGSTEPNPAVRFEAPGSYDCSVIISNDFEAFEFPFTLTVVPAG